MKAPMLPADYISHILYQSSYDEDLQGTVLAMNSDPWGIPVTYLGYALLFVSLVWILLDPKGTYRQLLRGERLEVRGKRYVKARFICLTIRSSHLQSHL